MTQGMGRKARKEEDGKNGREMKGIGRNENGRELSGVREGNTREGL